VRIYIALPGGKDVHVNRDPAATGRHGDMHVTIKDAFDAAGRQLQDQLRKLEGAAKTHAIPPHGSITMLASSCDHVFISASDGREIYLHRNCVSEGKFDGLEVDQDGRFSEDVEFNGRQATAVRPVGKHHLN
jgi:hypothetical protein